MQRVLRIFLAGAVICVPVIITVWVVWAAGAWLDHAVFQAVNGVSEKYWDEPAITAEAWPDGVGILGVLGLIFLVGLLTRFWFLAKPARAIEYLLERVPLVKTVYTSVRDMMRFFGGQSGSMGKVVLYKVPGADIKMLAVLTNAHPVGLPAEQAENKVAIWLPMSYMLGGYMIYVPADAVEPVDMSVEELLKLAATAEVGATKLLKAVAAPAAGEK